MNSIKKILDAKGIKQKWLSEQLNKSYNMVNSYVQNRRQPSLEDLYKIAEILKVNPKELLKDSINDIMDSGSYETIDIPVIGMVSCGLPIFAQENIDSHIPISVKMIKKGHRYFLLRAKGDSMNNAGINDGDLVLIRHQQHAENGDNVVALINDEATIKEFHHKGSLVVLKPNSDDKKYQPIILTDDFRIQGVVESVVSI